MDDFIARIDATLSGGIQTGQKVTAADVRAVRFHYTRRRGYDQQLVDEALDHYADDLDRLVS